MLNGNGLGVRWMVVIQIVSVVAAVLLAYATMSARLAVAEDRIETLRHDLENMRNYVRAMEERRRQ